MTTSYISIGSNVGDRQVFCRRAVEELRAHPGIEVDAVSGLYETSPLGGPPQRSYINLVVKIATDLNAHGVLKACKSIEQKLGREPSDIRWGPRVVDLDVLTYGDEKLSEPDLEIPHPEMTRRNFVLVPLLEIDPDASDPWGSRYDEFLGEAEGDVELIEPF